MIAGLGLLLGVLVGLLLQPEVPLWLQPYLPIAVVAALDAVRTKFESKGKNVEIIGLNDMPRAGDKFQVLDELKQAAEVAELRIQKQRERELAEGHPEFRVGAIVTVTALRRSPRLVSTVRRTRSARTPCSRPSTTIVARRSGSRPGRSVSSTRTRHSVR